MSDKETQSADESSSNEQPFSDQAISTRDSNQGASNETAGYSGLAQRFLWADSASAVERVIFWLAMLCLCLFILDFIVHRHAYAPGEGLPGFYAVVGFIAFTLIVLGASQLRRLILRDERYYSPNSVDSEQYPQDGLGLLEHGMEGQGSVESEPEQQGSKSRRSDVPNSSSHKDADQGDSA